MKKLSYLLLVGIIALTTSCGSNETKNEDSTGEAKINEATDAGKTSETTPDTSSETSGDKRFTLEQGMIEYEMNLVVATMNMTTYFKDYGAVQASVMKAEMMGEKTDDRELQKNGDHYRFNMLEKTGNKIIMDNKEIDPLELNFSNLSSEARTKYKIKDFPNEKYLDKDCKVMTFEAEGGTSKIWVWKGIPLKMTVSASGMNFDMLTATKISETPTFPADIFEIPKGFKITEVKASEMMPDEM